jgi:hypothetical protein
MSMEINDREVSILDVEHWLSKLCWFSERDIGGNRSFSTTPRACEAHLHPCMDVVWGAEVQKISQQAVNAMKKIIKDKELQF